MNKGYNAKTPSMGEKKNLESLKHLVFLFFYRQHSNLTQRKITIYGEKEKLGKFPKNLVANKG